ncbi:MAG: hypothetical protein SPL80_09180 [Bacilli bacterium]|nr:hypothetical protein [Bacilli bacterium]
MKDATKTISIIWGVLATIVFIALLVIATTLTGNNQATLEELVSQGKSEDDAKVAIAATAAIIFVFAFIGLASAVYSVVLATLVNNKKINRTVGIILGAAAIVLGSVLPGVLYIVDSVLNRDKNGAKPIEEPKEEKTEEKAK